jgi:glycogen operon protein
MKSKIKDIHMSTSGNPFPLGSSLHADGVNFCLFSRNCHQVELLLFNKAEDIIPKQVIRLDPQLNHTYNYWHVFVPGIKAGQLYGYRVHGPNEPHMGHRFDPNKVLLDPYAHGVAMPATFKRKSTSLDQKSETASIKSVVTT